MNSFNEERIDILDCPLIMISVVSFSINSWKGVLRMYHNTHTKWDKYSLMTYSSDKLFHPMLQFKFIQSLHWRISSKIQAFHDTHFTAEEAVAF